MRIFILADANSIHTKRWVLSLAKQKVDIFLFSFYKNSDNYYSSSLLNVHVYGCLDKSNNSIIGKIKYLFYLSTLRKKIKEFNPDILHAHYATSYGLLGALSNFHPYIISVWGSDIYDFPRKTILHSRVLKYILSNADKVLSTSHVMANETCKYIDKNVKITPFGVDTSLFRKVDFIDINADYTKMIIGNVKSLSYKYGIDILIRAFDIVSKKNLHIDLELVIVGEGPDKNQLKELTVSLGISNKVYFVGRVDNNILPTYYNRFLVAVSPSVLNESFGVVAVEAMACECPVVTSDADGFTEVVEDGQTGFIVPKKDVEATAKAIQKFIDEPDLRATMGKKGRERVLALYDWNDNVRTMLEIYNEILK